jgi:AcrR family transcriptional regulator
MSGQSSTRGAVAKMGAPGEREAGDEGRGTMRADARRNYDRLVTAAREVFSKYGGDASMEAIAKEAGVGVGTLYRHFPKRIDIVEAV